MTTNELEACTIRLWIMEAKEAVKRLIANNDANGAIAMLNLIDRHLLPKLDKHGNGERVPVMVPEKEEVPF